MSAGRVNTLSEAVARRLRSLRQQRGWTVQHLADTLTANGMPTTRVALSSLELGKRVTVTVDELYAFAAAFGIHPDQMVNGPACQVCSDAPPPGFACLNCGTTGAIP